MSNRSRQGVKTGGIGGMLDSAKHISITQSQEMCEGLIELNERIPGSHEVLLVPRKGQVRRG